MKPRDTEWIFLHPQPSHNGQASERGAYAEGIFCGVPERTEPRTERQSRHIFTFFSLVGLGTGSVFMYYFYANHILCTIGNRPAEGPYWRKVPRILERLANASKIEEKSIIINSWTKHRNRVVCCVCTVFIGCFANLLAFASLSRILGTFRPGDCMVRRESRQACHWQESRSYMICDDLQY